MSSSLNRNHRGGLALLVGLPLLMTLSACDNPSSAPDTDPSGSGADTHHTEPTQSPTADAESATPAAPSSASASSAAPLTTESPIPSLPPAPSVTASTWGQDNLAPREDAYRAPSDGAGPSGREDSDD